MLCIKHIIRQCTVKVLQLQVGHLLQHRFDYCRSVPHLDGRLSFLAPRTSRFYDIIGLRSWSIAILLTLQYVRRVSHANENEVEEAIFENGCILAACADSIHAFVIFCGVCPISFLDTYVRELLNVFKNLLMLASDRPYNKVRSPKLDVLVIVDVLVGLLAVGFSIDCK